MRRCLVHHPRRYAGARPVRLRNDDELDAAIGESPDYQYGLAAPGMERIVDPPLDRVFVGSLSLFRTAAARHEVAGSTVDECRFGASKGVRAEEMRVEANRCNPTRDEPSILPGCHAAVVITTATEQKFARFLASGFDVIVDSLPR